MKIIACGYRDWAKQVFFELKKNPKIEVVQIIEDNNELEKYFANFSHIKSDLFLFIGWSWIIKKDIINKQLCLGIHPSDLPNYRGGSPLQHQIIDGIKDSKVSLITLCDKLDGGDIWGKEYFDLTGDCMEEIFNNLVKSTIILLNNFIDKYPNIVPEKQDLEQGSLLKRRKQSESRITEEEFNIKNLKFLYNKIRCLTNPYPNAYIEDAIGNRLYFEKVRFEKAE